MILDIVHWVPALVRANEGVSIERVHTGSTVVRLDCDDILVSTRYAMELPVEHKVDPQTMF